MGSHLPSTEIRAQFYIKGYTEIVPKFKHWLDVSYSWSSPLPGVLQKMNKILKETLKQWRKLVNSGLTCYLQYFGWHLVTLSNYTNGMPLSYPMGKKWPFNKHLFYRRSGCCCCWLHSRINWKTKKKKNYAVWRSLPVPAKKPTHSHVRMVFKPLEGQKKHIWTCLLK